MGKHSRRELGTPTQVAYPWKSTARAVLIFGLSILPVLPSLADAADLDEVPTVVSILAIAAALQRVIALPPVDRLLSRIGLGAKQRGDYMTEENLS